FWAMHERLYAHQDALDDEHLLTHAAEIGLDAQRFRRDFGEHRFRGRVQEDVEGALHSGAHGTPTFFVNGIKHDGPATLGALMETIAYRRGLFERGADQERVDEASD